MVNKRNWPIFFYTILSLPVILSAQTRWYRGNIHTHTKASDGSYTLEEVIKIYQDRDYDFLVITDHDKVTPCEGYSTSQFLLIQGDEISAKEHWGALNLKNHFAWDNLSRQEIIDQINYQGAIPVIDHPRQAQTYFSLQDVLQLQGVHHMEVYNTFWESWRFDADCTLWDGVLSSGRNIYGVAADDFSHQKSETRNLTARGFIMVRSAALQRDQILSAIRQGDFYFSLGGEFRTLKVENGRISVSVVKGREIRFIGQEGKNLKTVFSDSAYYDINGTEKYVRIHAIDYWYRPAYSQPLYFFGSDRSNWRLLAVSGDSQTGTVNETLPTPLMVKLQDLYGNAITNEKIRFSVITGGGKVAGLSTVEVTTDAGGLASITATLGTVSGDTNNVYHAISEGAQGSPVEFKASARAGSAAKLVEISLNNQSGRVNHLLAQPFNVQILDIFSNPVSGHPVDFTVSVGGGTINGQSTFKQNSDASGYAAATLKLGRQAGLNTVLVSFAGLQGSPVTFNAEARAGNPANFIRISGDDQLGKPGQRLPLPFVVGVADSFDNPIENHMVQFVVTKGNGTIDGQRLVSVPTSALGRTLVNFTMGTRGPVHEITSSTQYNGLNIGNPIIFTATMTAGEADSLVYVSGNSQIAQVNSLLPEFLKLKVVDFNGAPVTNHPVTFLAIVTGSSFGGKPSVDVMTDANGLASAMPTIGSSVGDNNYIFQARAFLNNILLRNAPLVFFASGRKSMARKIEYVSGNNQQGVVGQYLPDSLRIRVVDGKNVKVAGHPVTFEIIQGSAFVNGLATTHTVLSNGKGVAVVALKMASQPSVVRVRVSSDDGVNPLTGSPLFLEATSVIGPVSASKSTRTVVSPVIADGIQNSIITVMLKDAEGNPIAGKSVQILTSGLDVLVKQPENRSDQNGMAQGRLSSIRSGIVKVWTVVDGKIIPADTSEVTFIAGLPTKAVSFGSGQWGWRDAVLPMPVGVYIYDAKDNPVPNVSVNFQILTGGGSILQSQPVKSNDQGKASVQWQLGSQLATQTMQAIVSGIAGSPIVFTAVAVAPRPGSIEMVSGDMQIGVFDQTLPDSFKVVVRDSTGKVAKDVQVYFNFTGQGQAESPNPATTNHRGIAALLYHPCACMTGEFTATATVPGLAQVVVFRFIVQNEPTIRLTKLDVKPSCRPKEILDLAVQALDAYNRPVKGQFLKFEVVEGLGSLLGTLPALTDNSGFARVKWQVGLTPSQKVQVSPLNLNAVPLIFSTTAVNNKPILTIPENMTIQPGQMVSREITALDADGDANTIRAHLLPIGAVFKIGQPNVFQWTPNNEQGGVTYAILFIATDVFMAADTAEWQIHVERINRVPAVVEMIPADTTIEHYYYRPLMFSIEAQDPDNDTLSYFWRVNNAFAKNQSSLLIFPDPASFPENTSVQVKISDGQFTVVVHWHVHFSYVQAVQLNNFQAQTVERKVELRWQTAVEVDNYGFDVLRATAPQGSYEVISGTMIPTNPAGHYTYVDESVQSGKTYFYKIRDIDRHGMSQEHGPVSVEIALPKMLALDQNYPNPFNPSTTISFELPKAQTVMLCIYNLGGQMVRTLASGTYGAGVYQMVWDGRDEQGRQVTSGIYYSVLNTTDKVLTKKLLLTK